MQSSSSDESNSSVETQLFRQLEGAFDDLSLENSTTSSATTETLNLADLRAAIEQVDLDEDQRQANTFVFPAFQEDLQDHINETILDDELRQANVFVFPPFQDDYNLISVQPPGRMDARRTSLLDPFRGDINPGETEGRKLYLSATKERDDDKKSTVRSDTAKVFMEAMVDDSAHFGWESLVNAI